MNPKNLNLAQEEVVLLSEGKKIHGWFFKQVALKDPKGLILFFHGNGENRSSHYLALSWMLEKGYDYFIFDYQGYGESEGKPSPESTVSDGISALKWFFIKAKEERYSHSSLIVFAQSLGGAVALRSLSEYQLIEPIKDNAIKWVVLDSTFLSYQKAGMSLLTKSWITFLFQPLVPLLLSDRWAPIDHLTQLPKTHFLVIHGNHDRQVDFKLGNELFTSLPSPKKRMVVKGGGHINGFFIENGIYRDKFLKIVESI